MLQSAKGIFHAGKIELTESPPAGFEGPVIVTFLSGTGINLPDRGIEPEQARDLRHRLNAFAEDWQRSEMDVYDAL
ncbi:MAG: hypothetical protein IT426_02790 [Pirellulales bacterium]|nr:hypothetical protein [Pirellulales bacterium]